MKEAIGQYEFSAVPRSLFSPDGEMLFAYDKSSILHTLEDLENEKQSQREGQDAETSTSAPPHLTAAPDRDDTYKVLIVDGMALVNAVQKRRMYDEDIQRLC